MTVLQEGLLVEGLSPAFQEVSERDPYVVKVQVNKSDHVRESGPCIARF